MKNKHCYVTQWFGENGVIFYKSLGLKGHNGVDFRTVVPFIYKWSSIVKSYIFDRVSDSNIRDGKMAILASHSGYLSVGFNDDSSTGIYMKIMSPEVEIDGEKCYVETVYFHLSRIRVWKNDPQFGAWEQRYGENYVPAGSVIGYGGNTGRYTTGPHLHFGMRIFKKVKDKFVLQNANNGYGGCVDPMPYFKDDVTYYNNRLTYYKGKKI
jgi:hypothetical protein